MKRFVFYILILSILSLACQMVSNLLLPTEEPTASANIVDMAEKLKSLNGKPCMGNSDFICVTLEVPLDHFDPANPETIEVVFAVSPAKGDRLGMYVQAFPGGPGGEGISYASPDFISPQVVSRYDIVFFDQRGVGLSNPLECKKAHASYFLGFLNTNDAVGEEGYDTPEEQQTAIQTAKSFVDECVAEIGIDPAKLKFFNTDQVAEDIESFRQAISDDKFMLYGVSYGTSVAQAYARTHADHLSGLILDGTQDTTLTGDELAFSQWEAFNMVLLEVFKACDADPDCSAGMGANSQAAYDELAQSLAEAPITYDLPVSNGKKVQQVFTFNMLDFTVAYQLYSINSRWYLMRAVAAAKGGDIVPMARLFYENANIDPETGEYMGDPNFSDTMYYIVWCSDDAYYNGTSEERSAKLMEEGQKLNGLIPRLDLDVLPLGLTCPSWPSATAATTVIEPLKAEDVPTFVLNATLDPATPFHEGKTVFENLDNGYHLYVEGGLHGIYGRGQACPNRYIENFLLDRTLPDQREVVCDWGNTVISP